MKSYVENTGWLSVTSTEISDVTAAILTILSFGIMSGQIPQNIGVISSRQGVRTHTVTSQYSDHNITHNTCFFNHLK